MLLLKPEVLAGFQMESKSTHHTVFRYHLKKPFRDKEQINSTYDSASFPQVTVHMYAECLKKQCYILYEHVKVKK